MSDTDKKEFIKTAIEALSQHFGKSCLDTQAVEDSLKKRQILQEHQSVDEILKVETPTYFKFGIHTTMQGRDYYALPCELSDDAFFDDASKEAMQKQLDNWDTELNDLDMSYLDTGILRKWSFGEGKWTDAQDQYRVTSVQDFSFVPRETFFDQFGEDLERYAKDNNMEVQDLANE